MDDLLRVDLPKFPSAYMVIVALFFLACAWGVSHMWFLHKQEESESAVLPACYAFATAVLSLGQITYFINRAAYHNLEIIHLPAVLLLCMMTETGLETFRTFHIKKLDSFSGMDVFRGAFTAMALLVLMTLCTGTVVLYLSLIHIFTQFLDLCKKSIEILHLKISLRFPSLVLFGNILTFIV